MANLLKPAITRGPRSPIVTPSTGKGSIRDIRGENSRPNVLTVTSNAVTPDLRDVKRKAFYCAITANLTLEWPLGAYVGAEFDLIIMVSGSGGSGFTLTLGTGWNDGDAYNSAIGSGDNSLTLFRCYVIKADSTPYPAGFVNRIGTVIFAGTLGYPV
jgi:hypothetical protein